MNGEGNTTMKLRLFLNQPNGKAWTHFLQMVPGLSTKYSVEIETETHTRDHYKTDEWFDTDLPRAPAIMLNDDVIVEGGDISEDELERVILSRLWKLH